MATRAQAEKAEQQRSNSAKKRAQQPKASAAPVALATPKPRQRTPKKRQNGVPSSRSSGQY